MAQRTCSVPSCGKPHLAKGYCTYHYGRWRRNGDPVASGLPIYDPICSVEGCERRSYKRGWCRAHYRKWLHYGDPLMSFRLLWLEDPDHATPNPSGLCRCGCGQPAPIAPTSRVLSDGRRIKAGEHYPWILNHDKRGLTPDIPPTATAIEIAWTAGIIEGEGSFNGSRRTIGSIQITAGQSDPWILRRLMALYGGHLCLTSRRCRPNGVDSKKDFWTWEIGGGRARGLATAIEPHLSPWRVVQLNAARQGLPWKRGQLS